MISTLLRAFDALAPNFEVSAPLCSAAAKGHLELPLDVHTICTRASLPRARSGDVERTLAIGSQFGLFERVGSVSWRSGEKKLADQLAPLLEGARLYRNCVHQDTDLVEVVLTKPLAPSQFSSELEKSLSGSWGVRDTMQLLPAIASEAQKSLVVMTPFLDAVGSLNLFENTSATDKCLILRAGKDGGVPEGLLLVEESLRKKGVELLNYRLGRPTMAGSETFHAKTVLGDENAAYVGSSNMNQWSFEYSLEMGLYTRGKAARQIGKIVHAIRAVSIAL
jgi:hypothetical protein